MVDNEQDPGTGKKRENRENPVQFEANRAGLPVVLPDIVVMRRQVVAYVYVPHQKHPDVHKLFADALDQAMEQGKGRCVIGRFTSESTLKYLCIGDISTLEEKSHG